MKKEEGGKSKFTVEKPGKYCLKTHDPRLIMRKTKDKFQLKDILQNTLSVLLKTVNTIKSKENVKNHHRNDD